MDRRADLRGVPITTRNHTRLVHTALFSAHACASGPVHACEQKEGARHVCAWMQRSERWAACVSDDGDRSNVDGCSSICTVEDAWRFIGGFFSYLQQQDGAPPRCIHLGARDACHCPRMRTRAA